MLMCCKNKLFSASALSIEGSYDVTSIQMVSVLLENPDIYLGLGGV